MKENVQLLSWLANHVLRVRILSIQLLEKMGGPIAMVPMPDRDRWCTVDKLPISLDLAKSDKDQIIGCKILVASSHDLSHNRMHKGFQRVQF